MSDIVAAAVKALSEKLGGDVLDGSAKFEIEGEGALIIDSDGVRASDDEADVTLTADAELFQDILSGDVNPTTAFMTGKSKDDQGRLPLHHACRKASPERIVRLLVRVFPRAAQVKDDQDKLALHYACQSGSSPNAIHLLLTTFPESINVKNGFGYTPLAEATSSDNGQMEPVIHILKRFKLEYNKMKRENGEHAGTERKIDDMEKRVDQLERMLQNVVSLGHELKNDLQRVRDPRLLVDKIADRLIALDGSDATDYQAPIPFSKSRSRSRSRSIGFRRNRKQTV